jgi:hypothetical protein
MKALRTPPSQLEVALLRWQLTLFEYIIVAAMPSSLEIRRSRERVIAAGQQRRHQGPRQAIARMKRMGKTRAEASEHLSAAYPDISPRHRTNILTEGYGRARQRAKK